MKLDKVANSKNDEFYTPLYAIEPILKYISKNTIIWCPFDSGYKCVVCHTEFSQLQINRFEEIVNSDNTEFILIRDNDVHWYVIPSEKRNDFDAWLNSEGYDDGVAPTWAEEVGGSQTLVKFKEYRINEGRR